MNVSKVNMNQLSFGRVQKEAAQIAIKEANGNIDELQKIKRLVEEQKRNKKVDVAYAKCFCSYALQDASSDTHYYAVGDNFEDMCKLATEGEKIIAEKRSKKPDKKDNDIDKIKREILGSCVKTPKRRWSWFKKNN